MNKANARVETTNSGKTNWFCKSKTLVEQKLANMDLKRKASPMKNKVLRQNEDDNALKSKHNLLKITEHIKSWHQHSS